jgi:hypothetical protein
MIPTRRAALLIAVSLIPLPAFGQGNSGGGGGHGGGGRGGEQGGRGRGGTNSDHGGRGDRGRGNSRGGQADGSSSKRGGSRPRMGNAELGTVQAWLGGNPSFTAQPLPPGMRNRLAQGKPLPPGIARRAVPPELLASLPVYPGYEYAMVGTSLALLTVGTNTLSTILSNAFGR